MLPVQVWNIVLGVAEELRTVPLHSRTWAELESSVRQRFADKLNDENHHRFTLYYILDLTEPHESRTPVSNQEELAAYLQWRCSGERQLAHQLFFHVAVIFQASGKPKSPERAPLSIDTALARASVGVGAARKAASRSHLSPEDAGSPQSPSTPRRKEFRQMVLARDSEGQVRPDDAKKQVPLPIIFCCVFCEQLYQPLPKQIDACHVIPHADQQGKAVTVAHLLGIGGSLEDIGNGVSVCSICHGVFDSGLLWVEVDATGVQRIFVHEDSRAVEHFRPLHDKLVRLPSDPSFTFPGAVAWLWRKEWALLKRQALRDQLVDAELAQSMGDASLQEPQTPKVPCSCGLAGEFQNQLCPNKLCKACCGLVGGCAQCKHAIPMQQR